MKDITKWAESALTGRMGLGDDMTAFIIDIAATAVVILIGTGTNWICQSIFRWFARHKIETEHSHWHSYLVKRHLGHHALLIIPGLVMYERKQSDIFDHLMSMAQDFGIRLYQRP